MRHPVTYCTNIHPGESWPETMDALATHTLAVKRAVCPNAPFPVGLRVSGLASRQITPRDARDFKLWLDAHQLYVTTLNGFPYGTFHKTPVKAQVYQPDWRNPERLDYTLRLARLLALWLPENATGSISTVPVGFRADFDPRHLESALHNIRAAAHSLHELAQETGAHIRLSIEPEPGCLAETTPQLVSLFKRLDLAPGPQEHLGVCYDCCHQALQYENPAESLALLADNAIPIGHVQVSSALCLPSPDLTHLARFDEPVYLHQCVARTPGGALARFDDLGDALCHGGTAQAWRVHFHLPVFLENLPGTCRTTQDFLRAFLPLVDENIPLEVETYTFDVLPEELKTPTVVESIVREIRWVEACRGGARG